MSVDPKFRTVGDFAAESPLDRQLGQLEENASRALSELGLRALARLTPTQTKTTDYEAKLGELVVTNASIAVRLPVASPKNSGEVVGILVQSGDVTVSAASGLVQGVAEDEIPASGVFLYESTGVGWWRPGGVTSITVGEGLTGGGTGAVDIGLDGDVVVTEDELNVAVAGTRQEVEKLRVLVLQLVKLEMGGELDNGWEAAGA